MRVSEPEGCQNPQPHAHYLFFIRLIDPKRRLDYGQTRTAVVLNIRV